MHSIFQITLRSLSLTVALNVVVNEVASISALIGPSESTMTMLASLDVLALIRGTIGPSLEALPMLLVLFPVATVLGSVQVAVRAESVSLVILPVAVIDIAIGMDQSALAVGFIVGPVALVHGAIWPDLDTFSLSDVRADEPLALVVGTIFEDDHLLALSIAELLLKRDVIVLEITELFAHFLKES